MAATMTPLNFLHLFDQHEVTLVSASASPFPSIPNPFWLVPQVQNGNVTTLVSTAKIESANPNPNPTPAANWQVLKASINSDLGVSLIMQDQPPGQPPPPPNFLVLTGFPTDDSGDLSGNWSGQSGGSVSAGTWSSNAQNNPALGLPFRFSWRFLIAPSGGGELDEFQTVIFDFQLTSDLNLTLQNAFPPGWQARDAQFLSSGIALQAISPPPESETYLLVSGKFSGGLDSLVCGGQYVSLQGAANSAPLNMISTDPGEMTVTDTGTWTGTSGGPMLANLGST